MLALCFCFLLSLGSSVVTVSPHHLRRSDFPPNFVFGSGTSAYQVEGAALEDGRTPSIFDTYTHGERAHGASGDIACNQYHKYKEDVQLMVKTGLEAYRFSISWSRLIPNGRGPTNPKGVAYYNNLINELISHGIQPHVTLLHSDTPQALEDEYHGWLSPKSVEDFTTYADTCFREFGDRVLHWTTFNEPNVFVLGGYDLGFLPPERCSTPFGFNCTKGNSSTEPYMAAHHILLAHASAARLYERKYRGTQLGFVGINLLLPGFIPYSNSTNDAIATRRAYDFFCGWFVDPLVFGDYPDTVKKNAGERLPVFTEQESEQMKGSLDFVGVNHYFTSYVKDQPSSLDTDLQDYAADAAIQLTYEMDDGANGFPIAPWGLQLLLGHLKQAYGNPPIFIHENGQKERRNSSLVDLRRIEYLKAYIGAVLHSVRNGTDVRGYFTWAFLDVLELLDFYQSGYGLYYVDLDDPDRKRYPKLSAYWYASFLKGTEYSMESTHSQASSK